METYENQAQTQHMQSKPDDSESTEAARSASYYETTAEADSGRIQNLSIRVGKVLELAFSLQGRSAFLAERLLGSPGSPSAQKHEKSDTGGDVCLADNKLSDLIDTLLDIARTMDRLESL